MIPLHDDNPTDILPVLTLVFIGLCVLVFLWQVSLGPAANQQAVYSLGVIPAVLLGQVSLPPELEVLPPALTIATSMFLHGGFMHLAGNMLYLWIFGNNVEDALGHARFLMFYFLCGAAAVFGQVLQNPSSAIPMIGASGAISGVLGAYLLLYPHARVLVLLPLGFYAQLIRLPAAWVLGFWFVLQLINSMLSDPGAAGVAWFAHIGGFIAGMALVPLIKRSGVKLLHERHGSRKWRRRWRG